MNHNLEINLCFLLQFNRFPSNGSLHFVQTTNDDFQFGHFAFFNESKFYESLQVRNCLKKFEGV